MADKLKMIQKRCNELVKENGRFRKRTEIVTQRLQRDYAELIKSFYRLQVKTESVFDNCREL